MKRQRSSNDSPTPVAKRLNFSIESIIESAVEQQQQQLEQLEPIDHLHNQSPASSSKSSSSGGSGTSRHNHQVNQQQQQQQQKPTCLSEARLSQVGCSLDNKEMWDKFHSLNTEMIITKTGRRMFPVMKVQFHNLDPMARYAVSMDIVPVDNKRYRYAYHKSCWQQAGKADPSAEPRLYPHPDSPFNGDLLARQVISFEKVKLTNNEMDKSGHIILNSMHKYQPRVHLIELKQTVNHHHNHHQSTSKGSSNNHQQQPQLDIEGYRTFVFPETVFTAVTAYQNQLITKMKIDKNPFAKGFRDSSRLSDLDRNDPFDYMGPLGPCPSGRGFAAGPAGIGSMLGGGASGPNGGHCQGSSSPMDAYSSLLAASAANNSWYSAAMAAAANINSPVVVGAHNATNPFQNPAMAAAAAAAAAACSTSQAQAAQASAAQLQATQMWLAALSACLNNGAPTPTSATTATTTASTAGNATGSSDSATVESEVESP